MSDICGSLQPTLPISTVGSMGGLPQPPAYPVHLHSRWCRATPQPPAYPVHLYSWRCRAIPQPPGLSGCPEYIYAILSTQDK